MFAWLFGSMAVAPPQLVSSWLADGEVEVTVPEASVAACTATFEWSDGHATEAWTEDLPAGQTTRLTPTAPAKLSQDGPLLLSFQGTCSDSEGREVEVSKLSAVPLLVEQGQVLDDLAALPRVDADGVLELSAAFLSIEVGDARPADDSDDDAPDAGGVR